MNTQEKLYHGDDRTEEVQQIIERMPVRFGFWITLIVVGLFLLTFLFGWLVRYPDVVTGQIVVNANSAPLRLIANSSGKLKLMKIKSMESIAEGQVIGYIENPTSPSNVLFIDNMLKKYNPNSDEILGIQKYLPKNYSLGELNGKYYSFSNSLREYIDFKQDRALDKQNENLIQLLKEQKEAIETTKKRIDMARSNLSYVYKFFKRDSLLFAKKVISESELDKSQMNYLSSKDGLQNAINNNINARQSAQQTQSQMQGLSIQKPEKGKELRIALISTYNDLVDNIKSWEQKYVFRAPFGGKVQFLKFYTENQFIIAGEQVFTIVPKQEKVFGQVVLPAAGSGKLKIGQEVIVKLDNFPFLEYGSITGKVNSMSLTTSVTKTERNDIETYMIKVDFPNQLKTNYGTVLDFKAEAKGTADIITSDRRLIERLFDNLKYIMKK